MTGSLLILTTRIIYAQTDLSAAFKLVLCCWADNDEHETISRQNRQCPFAIFTLNTKRHQTAKTCFHVVSKTETQRSCNNYCVLQVNTISESRGKCFLVFRGHLKSLGKDTKRLEPLMRTQGKKKSKCNHSQLFYLIHCLWDALILWQTVERVSNGVMALQLALALYDWSWSWGCWMCIASSCAEHIIVPPGKV